jgi:hypothetical protein
MTVSKHTSKRSTKHHKKVKTAQTEQANEQTNEPAQPAKTAAKTAAKTKNTTPPLNPTSQVTPVRSGDPTGRVNRWLQKAGHFAMHSSLLEALLIATLLLARYLINSDFSYPTEVILPIVLFAILGSAIFYLYKLVLKQSWLAHAAALPLIYGLYGYSYAYPRLSAFAQELVPERFETPFAVSVVRVLVWAVAFGLIAYLAGQLARRVKPLGELPLLKIATFAICFIFVVQVAKVGVRLFTIRHQLNYHANNQVLKPTKQVPPGARPNIYYLVFDRYASNETLASVYNFDNQDMMSFLDEQGFTTRQNSYANYPFTPQSVSSTLQMSYHTSLGRQFKNDARGFQTAFPYRDMLNDSLVAETLKKDGYDYNQVSSWWDFTRNNPTADNEPSRSFRLRLFGLTFWQTDMQRDIVNKSVLSPWLLKGMTIGNTAIFKYDRDYNPAENFGVQMMALKSIADRAAKQQKPQFTFGHILSPHDPYVFNADGSPTTISQNRDDDGADETVKYATQLNYVNTQFKQLLAHLRAKDPGAVIIVQSDEGPYPKQFRGKLTPTHYYDPKDLPLPQLKQKFGIIASYYLPGEQGRAAAQSINSSVNTFRVVFSHYLGYDLPLLPDCQFTAGNKFYMYDFRLISGKLKGTDEPDACKQY